MSMSWFVGLIEGDGYTDDRHIEIYNSSVDILKEAVKIFRKSGIPKNKIKFDIYMLQN